MGRIVVGVDGSAPSKEALRWAAEEAGRRGDVVEAVLVWDDPYRDMWLPSEPPGSDPLAHLRFALDRTVSAVLDEPTAAKVETVVVQGHAARALVDRARGADLLVVGNRGHGGLAGAFVGSVSINCISHAPCPVVVVHEPVPSPGRADAGPS